MAITLAETAIELYDRRGMAEGEDGHRSYNRAWRLRLDLSTADAGDLAAIEDRVEALIPVARYDSHPSYAPAFARTVSLKALALDLWEAEVGYRTMQMAARTSFTALPTGSGGAPPKPDRTQDKHSPANTRLPEFWVTRRDRKKPLEQDALSGADVKNTAGDPYDPPLEVSRSQYNFHFRWWKVATGFDMAAHLNFIDLLNNSTQVIAGITCAAKTLKVDELGPKLVWDTIEDGGNKTYSLVWELTAVLHYDSATHRIKNLNAGKRAKKTAGGAVAVARDDSGVVFTDPVPLAADGTKLAAGAAYVFQTWDGYLTGNFSTLLA